MLPLFHIYIEVSVIDVAVVDEKYKGFCLCLKQRLCLMIKSICNYQNAFAQTVITR